MEKSQIGRFLGAVLLIAGTTIGAAMLALPVTLGLAGFWPSLLVMLGLWLLMLLSAFYFLEVNLRWREEIHLISMANKTLGRPGKIATWCGMLLLLYALTAAYLVGCSQIIEGLVKQQGISLHSSLFLIGVTLLFASLMAFGVRAVDVLNRFMMIGLASAYALMLGAGFGQIHPTFLTHFDRNYLLSSISIGVTAFGFHVIIPSLTSYLKHNKKMLVGAIWVGSAIPLFVYLLWQVFVMGVVPISGTHSLTQASSNSIPISLCLQELLSNHWVSGLAHSFAFFAIVTSLLGVTLALIDFLADGLQIQKTGKGIPLLLLLAFLPPLLFGLFYPKGFVLALRYAGILVLLLLVLLPALMALAARSNGKGTAQFQVIGGKTLIFFTICLSLILLCVEVLQL
jgi:tyrosine-specific transport protein